MKTGKLKTLKNIALDGVLKSNPTFRLVLGMCPTLAVTMTALNGLTMGLATTIILTITNMIISLLRNIIPDKLRIPSYILLIATFVTILEMLMGKFLPSLYESLALYISLIVVNCIIFARAESFASVNPVLDSMVDGFSMGLGFTLSLTLIGIIRELLANGEFFGLKLFGGWSFDMIIFGLPAGGFLVLGLLMAAINGISNRIKREQEERKKG